MTPYRATRPIVRGQTTLPAGAVLPEMGEAETATLLALGAIEPIPNDWPAHPMASADDQAPVKRRRRRETAAS